jgi:hypothetical protein
MPRLSPDASFVVTDLNQPMLDYAATRQVADSRISWRKADAQALPFEDAAFDPGVFFGGGGAALSNVRSWALNGTFRDRRSMSAFGGKADIAVDGRNVCFEPKRTCNDTMNCWTHHLHSSHRLSTSRFQRHGRKPGKA